MHLSWAALPTVIGLICVYQPPGLAVPKAAVTAERLSAYMATVSGICLSLLVAGDLNSELSAPEGSPDGHLRRKLEGSVLISVRPTLPTHRRRCIDWVFASAGVTDGPVSSLLAWRRPPTTTRYS